MQLLCARTLRHRYTQTNAQGHALDRILKALLKNRKNQAGLSQATIASESPASGASSSHNPRDQDDDTSDCEIEITSLQGFQGCLKGAASAGSPCEVHPMTPNSLASDTFAIGASGAPAAVRHTGHRCAPHHITSILLCNTGDSDAFARQPPWNAPPPPCAQQPSAQTF